MISARVANGESNESPRATSRIASNSSSGPTPLPRNPLAPDRSAWNTYSSSSKVVSTNTFTPANTGSAMIALVAASPSISGIRMSISTTSTPPARTRSSASRPVVASPTTSRSSADSISTRNPARSSAWSSASSTLIVERSVGVDMPYRARSSGSVAATTKPPSGVGPARSSPPTLCTRSRMPIRPNPAVDPARSRRPWRPGRFRRS